ncbi:hypothetical protein FQR65_LT03337 [Abscondita terminalis]|nr:hypothetical protein FQR65_LT03337 [Abscondita terminalis]
MKFIVVVFVEILVLTVVTTKDIATGFTNAQLKNVSNTCFTEACIQASYDLQRYIDQTVNPCVDFYQFSCGNFVRNTRLGRDSIITIETLIRDHFDNHIRDIIQAPQNWNDTKTIKMAKSLFSTCMNPSAVENGKEFIKDTISEIGGWAVLYGELWRKEFFNWKSTEYAFRRLGYKFEHLIKLRIIPDERRPSQRIIQFASPVNPLSNLNVEEEEQLLNDMVNTAVAFGAKEDFARKEYKQVIEFLRSLLPTSSHGIEYHNRHDDLTIAELHHKYRDIPWLEFTQYVFLPVQSITLDQPVSITDTPYFLKLQKALTKVPKRVLNNYLVWRIIMESSNLLTEDMNNLGQTFFKSVNKDIRLTQTLPRPDFCSALVETIFPLPIQASYISKHVTKEIKDDVTNILQSIIDEFKEEIINLSWMDDETRGKSLDRLSMIKTYVVFPSKLFNSNKVYSPYQEYDLPDNNLLDAVLTSSFHATNARFKELHEPIDKEIKHEHGKNTAGIRIFTTNRVTTQSVTIPARALQSVIYDIERPKYYNYGTLGSMIGHQLFHAVFGRTPSRYDSRYYQWLTSKTQSGFNKKLECIEHDYAQYLVPETQKYLNSTNSKYEDIADLAGVKLAYDAYAKWLENNSEELKLPKLNYSNKQLFWISSAIRFCLKASPEAIENLIEYKCESLTRYKVLGAPRNIGNFFKDFKCPSYLFIEHSKCNVF